MWRYWVLLLVVLGVTAFPGCGKASSAPQPPSAEQERQMEEKKKQVEAEERLHQEQERKAAPNSPRR